MRLTVTPAMLFIVAFLLIVWWFRYEYVTRQLQDVSCVERVNRYTRDRCLVSGQVPECRKVLATRPCEI